jgi:tetratricopeptide (TPR) repeat protein
LIGLAWWDAGALQVEQLFMRDFGEEHAILHEVAARLAERPVLVTFNGKSFDWPLLENRFTMTRSIAVPRLAAHLDLLHPARALWKLRLGSVRLVELERHVLDATRMGWHREEDVLAALIPQHYFDYLRGGPAEPLAAVVRHNQMDLRGLAALVGKIDALLTRDNGPDVESLDLFGLSRYLQRRGDSQRAHSTCTQAIDLGLPKEYDRQARRELALLAKRRGEHEQAAKLWHELAGDESAGVYACVQLAIYYERRAKRLEAALEFARLALAKVRCLKTNTFSPPITARDLRLEPAILNRVARLEHRMKLGRV